MNYEAWNRYVLIAIGLFTGLLYIGLIYAGFAELMTRLSKGKGSKKRRRNRGVGRTLRSPKASGH